MIATSSEPITITQAPHASNRLAIRAPFAFKDTIKALPGAQWQPEGKYWHIPATPASVGALKSALTGNKVRPDQFFRGLLADYQRSAEANGIKSATELELTPIPGARIKPWLHQTRAFHYTAANKAVLLAMGMGSGKSAVVVHTIAAKPYASKSLILAPKSVIPVWPLQFSRHTERPIIVAAPRKAGMSVAAKLAHIQAKIAEAELAGQPIVVVVNYETAWRDPFGAWALGQTWDLVVLDESHKIKAPGGKASMFCSALGAHARQRMCLTGTPMPHSPLDVYSQYRFLDPGVFGSNFAKFRARYAIMGGYENRQILDWRDLDDLNRRMYSIAFRVETRDVVDLPPAIHSTRFAELGAKAARVYKQLQDDFIAYLKGETSEPDTEPTAVVANHTLTRLLRLAQVANGFAKDENGQIHQIDTAKEDVLADELDNLSPSEPVVVFCRFTNDLDTVRKVAEGMGRSYSELSGRANDLEKWQAGGSVVLGVQIQAGGAGIDLTRSAYVFYWSTGFSYGDYEQSLARAVRPGQTRPVTITHILTAGTVDEYIQQVLEAREALVTGAMQERKPDISGDVASLLGKLG